MGTAVDEGKGFKERRSIALCGVHTEECNCPRGWPGVDPLLTSNTLM